LARRGHAVTVATGYSPRRLTAELNGVAVRQFRIDGVLQQSALGIRGEISAFCRFLRDSDFDVVMNYAAQTWHTDLTFRCLPYLRARTVLAACGYSGLVGWRRPLYWGYFLRLPRYLRQYDAVVYHAAGYRDHEFGARHGIAHGCVIPNGIDSGEFVSPSIRFRELYGIRTPHLLLCVGDHYANKGHRRVLDAFCWLNRTDTTLVIIGRPSAAWPRGCLGECRRRARTCGGRVLLLEQAPRDHVAAAYQAATVFISGSLIEAFPLVILEAMGSALPFVAYPAGNVADLRGGMVVRTGEEMVAALGALLNDPSLRARLGEEGRREQRSRYEWERVVDQYESLYRRLLDQPRRRVPIVREE
jgi:glycosyltransferase involved in cell wall biosynthesis